MGRADGLHRWLQDPAHGRPSTPPINLFIFHCGGDTEANVIVSESPSPLRAAWVFSYSVPSPPPHSFPQPPSFPQVYVVICLHICVLVDLSSSPHRPARLSLSQPHCALGHARHRFCTEKRKSDRHLALSLLMCLQ